MSQGSPPALSLSSLICTTGTVAKSVSPRGGRLGQSHGEMDAHRCFINKRITKQVVLTCYFLPDGEDKLGVSASKAHLPRCAPRHINPMRCSRGKKGFLGQMCWAMASLASWKAPYIAYKSWLRKFLVRNSVSGIWPRGSGVWWFE